MYWEKQHHVFELFCLTDQTIKRCIGKRVEETGVYRSQHRILMLLGGHPDLSQAEIAELLDISPAAVAVSLKKLEKAGFIVRQSHKEDNRINHVAVTEKGKETIEISIACFREMESAVLKDFTPEEMEVLEQCFRRIIQNGEEYYQSLLNQENRKG